MPVILVDQNVPRAVCSWLAAQLPGGKVVHTSDLGLAVESDETIGVCAMALGAIVLTFDEDFLDSRTSLRTTLPGVIRLRVWPTRVPFVIAALERLLGEVEAERFAGNAIVVDRHRIRVRPL